ncbi:cardiolipin synthase [Hathewaya histolytica]|uniref:Cardiolipin synthase n=1 Tax=Hathewaya histolytica TaxID=1498 RepID=A0A4U9RN55_HATHI|nr:cardiolipin synthase [Hathewaya histolytica]VTQ92163.1 cardiolipin synthetase [Hathewaya histolytica]
MIYFNSTIYKLLLINSIIALIIIILERRRPEKTIAWLVIFLAFPPLGLICYIFMGRNWKKNKLKDDNFDFSEQLRKAYDNDITNNKHEELMNLLKHNSSSPIFYKNEIDILNNGEEKFKALKRELKNAKHHIHIEYYIFKSDNIGKEIIEILKQKAMEGVQVRVILDKVGSLKFKRKYVRELKKVGVDIVFYTYFLAPFLRFINTQINYRNHRKIVIIDGKIGFLGGINIGDEYLGQGKLGFWRDTHLMIKGDCVLALQAIFIHDFCNIKKVMKEEFKYEGYIEDYFKDFRHEGKIMQIAKSGPNSENPAIMQAIITMMSRAKKRIYITTPYFVPTESIMTALKIAALEGVNIKILFPGRYDHFHVYYASRTYLSELMEYGVEVYFYNDKSFIHSKIITVDGELATVGTANMDVRSFELNYEVNAVIYDKEITVELENYFLEDLKHSNKLSEKYFKDTSFAIKVLEAIARIFSNLL